MGNEMGNAVSGGSLARPRSCSATVPVALHSPVQGMCRYTAGGVAG